MSVAYGYTLNMINTIANKIFFFFIKTYIKYFTQADHSRIISIKNINRVHCCQRSCSQLIKIAYQGRVKKFFYLNLYCE